MEIKELKKNTIDLVAEAGWEAERRIILHALDDAFVAGLKRALELAPQEWGKEFDCDCNMCYAQKKGILAWKSKLESEIKENS